MRVRFAPSPTGHLHVGNARTALFNWLLARHAGGTFILRVEDTDRERSTAASEAAIKDDLHWLGLDGTRAWTWAATSGPYRQSERLALYAQHTERLLDGGHAYHCFCSPETARGRAPGGAGRRPAAEVLRAAADRSPWPTPRARRLAGERPAVRLRVPSGREVAFDDLVRGSVAFHTEVIGDPVIVRGDGVAGLQLRRRDRRRADAHHPRRPRRGPHLEHAAPDPGLRGLRLDAAGLRASLAGARPRPRAAVEAPRRDLGGRVPRQGLPARGAGQLPGADRLVARRRRRGAAARRTGPPVRPRRRGPQRRRLRRSQAGLGQSALPQAGRSGSAGGAVPAVSRAATPRCRSRLARPRRRGCARYCRRWPRRSTGSTSCPSG